MAIIIGSARIDENGNTHGGSAGDQSGSEVSTQEFYMHSKGWVGFRAKSDSVAAGLATAMKEACDNNNIGYDQYQRDTLLTQFKQTKSIKAVSVKCECDCSSLVRVCIYQASGTLLSDFNTESESSVLMNSGMFDKVTVNSSADVDNGMILCTKTKGHTVIVISGRARSSSSSSSGTTSSTGSTTSSSSDKVTATESASSKDESLAGTYKTTANLNIRNGAGTTKKVLVTAPSGTSVQNYGYYSTVSGTKWLYVQFTYQGVQYTGFASSKYLTKTSSSSSSTSSGTTSSTTSGTTSSTTSSNSGDLTVDGQIGANTTKKWQKVMGTTQDGKIDGQPSASKKYWTSILSSVCSWSGGTSKLVKAWQQYLKNKGYSPGTADGKLGKNTAKASQQFLSAKGYYSGSIDSYFGAESAKGLQKWLNKQ